jgi:hypothetical protein
MTEAERYEKRAPSQKNNKPTPQQLWTRAIADAVEAAPAHLKHYMKTMSQLDNVPRKEKQFRNFTANSLNLRGGQKNLVVSEIWSLLQEQRQKQQLQELASKSAEAAPGGPVASESISAASESRPVANGGMSEQQPPTSNCTDRIDPTVSDESSPSSMNEVNCLGAKSTSSRRAERSNSGKKGTHGASSSRKKEVKKAIKRLLKKAKDRSLGLKALRRAVREQLNLPKKDAKRYVAGIVSDKSNKVSTSSFELVQKGSKTTVRLRA